MAKAKTKSSSKKTAVKKTVVKKTAAKKTPKKAAVKKQVKIAKKVIIKKAKPASTKSKPVSKPTKTISKKPVVVIKKAAAPATKSKVKGQEKQVRYSDKELLEFKVLIQKKIADAKSELANLTAVLNHSGDHGTDDTANTFKMLEDGSESMAKEEAAQLAARQKKFIEQLDAALMRIENKTYGICRVTGKLIPKPRLRAVPHTTQSMEAKLKQYN